MPLLEQFDLPGSLSDLDDWPSRKAQWGQTMSGLLDSPEDLANALRQRGKPTLRTLPQPQPQIYNPLTQAVKGPVFEQAITWNAFPLELLRRFGRARALAEADRLWPITPETKDSLDQKHLTVRSTRRTVFFRPQSEYCEWRVERDPGTGRMLKVTFTSEIADYWMFLFGEGNTEPGGFERSRRKVLELYRELLGEPAVQADSLLASESDVSPEFAKIPDNDTAIGQYNVFNRWNTTRGIVHLSCKSNRMTPALQLVAASSYLYGNASNRLLTYPEAICSAIGSTSGNASLNRHSDVAVSGAINALARDGMLITLANPPGICIDHIDTSGWQLPGGIAARDCWEVERGSEDNILRLVVRMPPQSGYTLSDLNIAGEPLRYGGQLAECVTVRLIVAAAGMPPGIVNPMLSTTQTSLVVNGIHPWIVQRAMGGPPPEGMSPAFAGYDYPAPPRPQ